MNKSPEKIKEEGKLIVISYERDYTETRPHSEVTIDEIEVWHQAKNRICFYVKKLHTYYFLSYSEKDGYFLRVRPLTFETVKMKQLLDKYVFQQWDSQTA